MHKRLIGGATTVAVSVVLYACGGSGNSNPTLDVSQGTVLLNATVVSTRDGTLTSGMSIVVDGGKIQQIISATTNITVSGSAQAVDATGKFVVPGFVDMHTHAMVRSTQNPTYFPFMIANGITGFREMGEFPGSFPNMPARAAQLNADIAAGRVDAPEALLVPGDIFPASPAPTAPPTTVTAAIQGVKDQKAQGVGFIKVISATRDGILAFLSENKNQGLTLAGHLAPAISATESSQAGWKSIEHLGSRMGILLDCSNDEASMRQALIAAAGTNSPGYPTDAASLQRVVDTHNVAKCQDLAKVFVQNGTWHVPTLRRVRGLDIADDPVLVNDPNLIYVDKTRLATWNTSRVAYSALPAATKTASANVYALKRSVTKLLKQNGVKMMAGSDAGQASTWTIPGFGLHEDFHELTASGLTPLDILQMTTLNPAEFLNRQSTMGSVDVGKNADLVVLDANPIADAANLDKISGVLLKGKYFSKIALEKMKSDVAAIYASQPALTGVNAVIQPDHVD